LANPSPSFDKKKKKKNPKKNPIGFFKQYQTVFKIHLFHTKYTTNKLTYLLTYRLRLTDINIVV